MTTPNQAAPDGAFTIGGGQWNYGQTMSESFGKSMFEMETPTTDNMLELLQLALTRLPLDALKPFQGIFGLAEELFDNVENAVGAIIDSLGLRPIAATLETFAEWVIEFFQKLTGVFTGNIDVFVDWFFSSILSVFNWIPLSHIFPKPINLLKFGAFDSELDLSPTNGWQWDPSTTATGTSSGSAKAVANGSNRQLFRKQEIPVEAGTKLNLSARVKSSGLSSGGEIVLSLVEYNGDYLGDIVTVASRGGSSGWVTLQGEYTVPANISTVFVRLAVEQASSGTVWFDDLNLYRSGLLQINWIEGLQGALDAAGDWFQTFIDGFFEALYGLPIIGATLEQIFTGIGDLVGDVEGVIGDLADLVWGLLNNVAGVLGTIPRILVDGLNGLLGSIGTQATNAWNNVTGLAASLLAAPAAVVGSILNVVVDGVATMGQFLSQLWEGLTGNVGSGKTVANVKTAGGSLLAIANGAQVTADTGVGNAAIAQSTASNAEAQAVANAAEIAKIVAANNGSETSGNYAYDNFDYVVSPFATSTDWSVAGSGGGSLAVNGSKLYWVDSGGAAGSRICRFLKTKTATPYQLVTMVLDAPKVEGPLTAESFNYLIGRLNSALTSYVYAKIGYNSVSIWKVVAGSGEFQIGTAASYTPQVGDTIQFVLGNPDTSDIRQFKVKVNNSTVLTVTDGTFYGGVLSLVDAEGSSPTNDYKWSGMAFYAAARFGGGQTTPGAVSIFSVSDNKPAPMLGSGLRANRGSGTNATISSGDNIFPLGWFGNCDKTLDLTYDSQTARVTVSVEGWYQVIISQDGDGAVAVPADEQIRAILFKGVGTGSRAVDQRGTPVKWTSSVGFNGFGGTFIIYLKPGEWIEPGYSSTASSGGTQFFTGTGANTWFSMSLINRSYN